MTKRIQAQEYLSDLAFTDAWDKENFILLIYVIILIRYTGKVTM